MAAKKYKCENSGVVVYIERRPGWRLIKARVRFVMRYFRQREGFWLLFLS